MNKKNNNNIIFEIDLEIYPVESIISTSYLFLDDIYIFLDNPKDKRVKVSLTPKKKYNKKQLEILKQDFLNHLLSNVARIVAIKRNKKVKEFIVGRALFSAAGNPLDDDYFDDPLDIDVPWEVDKDKH